MDAGMIRLWHELKSLYDMNRSPVPTGLVADFAEYSERQARRKLRALEERQKVRKVSKRGGWVPVAPVRGDYVIQLELPLMVA